MPGLHKLHTYHEMMSMMNPDPLMRLADCLTAQGEQNDSSDNQPLTPPTECPAVLPSGATDTCQPTPQGIGHKAILIPQAEWDTMDAVATEQLRREAQAKGYDLMPVSDEELARLSREHRLAYADGEAPALQDPIIFHNYGLPLPHQPRQPRFTGPCCARCQHRFGTTSNAPWCQAHSHAASCYRFKLSK